MKAVILAASQDARLKPLTKYYPKFMFPVFNRPMIDYILYSLKRAGITEVIFCLRKSHQAAVNYLGDGNRYNMKFIFSIEELPIGTAGAIKKVEPFINEERFWVISSHVLIQLNFHEVLNFHKFNKALATIVITQNGENHLGDTKINYERDITLQRIAVRKKTSIVSVRPIGCYLFEPEVLDYIDPHTSYVDLREELIPKLKFRQLPVYTFNIDSGFIEVNSIDDYFNLQDKIIQEIPDFFPFDENSSSIIWKGQNVFLGDNVKMHPPVIIGDSCEIGDSVNLIGPVTVGENSKIEKGSIIKNSIIWPESKVGEKSSLDNSLIAKGTKIAKQTKFKNGVLMDVKLKIGEINLLSMNKGLYRIVSTGFNGLWSQVRFHGFSSIKRIVDIIGSIFALFLFFPILFVTAIAVKLDSRGPVFFRQNRCGKNGKFFSLIKFRSMTFDPGGSNNKLKEQNEVEGPMFKISNDPRVTKVGKIIRKASIDEIPQFINVLKGDMSLVGPRPLADEEMKYNPYWRDIRTRVKPGITGLWQVNGRSNSTFQSWIKYDINYVREQSIGMDLKILLKTPMKVLVGTGAY